MGKDRRRAELNRRLVRQYGITAAEYDRILKHQGGGCAVCRREPKNVRLGVDHNHKSGEVRGLLCWTCNKTAAYLRDDPERAARITWYLRTPPAPTCLGRVPVGRVGRVSRRWTKADRAEADARVKALIGGKKKC